MSSINGISTNALSGILNSLVAKPASPSTANSTSDSTSSDSTSPSTTATTSAASTTSSQADSLRLMAAQAQLSMIGALLDDSSSSATSMDQLAMSAENYKILTQSNILQAHPELVNTLLNNGTSSLSSTEEGDSLSSITSSGSNIDFMA